MTDIAAAEYTLNLKGTHRPSIPFTDWRPLYHNEDPCPDGTHQPLDNRRMEWLVNPSSSMHFVPLEIRVWPPDSAYEVGTENVANLRDTELKQWK